MFLKLDKKFRLALSPSLSAVAVSGALISLPRRAGSFPRAPAAAAAAGGGVKVPSFSGGVAGAGWSAAMAGARMPESGIYVQYCSSTW